MNVSFIFLKLLLCGGMGLFPFVETLLSSNITKELLERNYYFQNNFPVYDKSRCRSVLRTMCSYLDDADFMGCCKPFHVKVFYNVLIKNGKLVIFNEPVGSTTVCNSSSDRTLPPILSTYLRKVTTFQKEIIIQNIPFQKEMCSKMFEGTLHVMGRSTVHNLFHTCKQISTIATFFELKFPFPCDSSQSE